MKKFECIKIFRDSRGKIIGYRLRDEDNRLFDGEAKTINRLIKSGEITVIDRHISSYDSSDLADYKTALEFTYIDNFFNGDKYTLEGLSEDRCKRAGIKYDEDDCVGCLVDAHERLLNSNDGRVFELNLLRELFTNKSNIEYIKRVIINDINKFSESKTYTALRSVYRHVKTTGLDGELESVLKRIMNDLKTDSKVIGIDAANLGSKIGHEYFNYLNKELFGTITNDVYTVGNLVSRKYEFDYKYLKGYSYVIHKNINLLGSPRIDLVCAFKDGDSKNTVIADIKVARKGCIGESTMGTVGYIQDLNSLNLDTFNDLTKNCKYIATMLNLSVRYLYDLANCYPSLYNLLPLGAPLEVVGDKDEIQSILKNKDDLDLLNSAISRITLSNGDRTPAIPESVTKHDKFGYVVVYSNNVGSKNKPYKVMVNYRDDIFKVKIVDANDINNVLITKEALMANGIKPNSMNVSEVIGAILISLSTR